MKRIPYLFEYSEEFAKTAELLGPKTQPITFVNENSLACGPKTEPVTETIENNIWSIGKSDKVDCSGPKTDLETRAIENSYVVCKG